VPPGSLFRARCATEHVQDAGGKTAAATPAHAIWWHVYPLGFTGAEPAALSHGEPPRHRLPRLAGWLDYAAELGCSGLLLGPVFAAGTHGYDTIDHFRVDPRLGDDEDFDALVARGAGWLLGQGAARGAGVAPGRLVPRGDDPR
jgi:Alpha amylase, catalytic domain